MNVVDWFECVHKTRRALVGFSLLDSHWRLEGQYSDLYLGYSRTWKHILNKLFYLIFVRKTYIIYEVSRCNFLNEFPSLEVFDDLHQWRWKFGAVSKSNVGVKRNLYLTFLYSKFEVIKLSNLIRKKVKWDCEYLCKKKKEVTKSVDFFSSDVAAVHWSCL